MKVQIVKVTRKYTPSECAKMGSQRSREVSAEIKRKNLERYLRDPKKCEKCGKVIQYDQRRNRFCSKSCAQSVNNIGVRRHGNPKVNCLLCGKPAKNNGNLGFCCISHARIYNANNKIPDEERLSSKPIKRRLIAERGYRCEECKLETWMGKPIPLDVHHIDGDHKNNHMENVKILCKNCHGLTTTYAKKKVGTNQQKSQEPIYPTE